MPSMKLETLPLSRRAFLAAGAASLSARAFAALVPAASGMKIVSVLARKEGMTHAAFVRHWIEVHGQLAAAVPGVAGFVGSEPLAGASQSAGLFGEVDGIASIWFAGPDASGPAMRSATGKAWLADGDRFISRARSHNFITKEHVVKDGPRVDGAIKRMLFVVRRADISRDRFLEHWLGRHADLARQVPGITRSVFSEVTGVAGGPAGLTPAIDGIAESWWTGPGTESGGKIASREADAWASDGDTFVDNARSRLILCREHVVIAPGAA